MTWLSQTGFSLVKNFAPIFCEVKILVEYILKYWFEDGGNCLWSVNDHAKNKFNYDIDNEKLPISRALVDELYALEAEYRGYLDWDYPLSPSPWTPKQKSDFKKRANETYLKLLSELGTDFKIINEIDKCIV